jgi:hypothetical protein
MHPQEPRTAGRERIQHREGAIDDLVGGPLGFEHVGCLRVARDAVVVLGESRIESEPPIEDERTDDRARGVPGGLESRGNRRMADQAPGPVEGEAMCARGQTRHDRGVSRQRQGHDSARLREPHALSGQSVERRREAASQPIGARGVERHEQDVRSHGDRPVG